MVRVTASRIEIVTVFVAAFHATPSPGWVTTIEQVPYFRPVTTPVVETEQTVASSGRKTKLVRPLVAYQHMLTREERAYWEPYLYQSPGSQPETYLDYLNTTGRNCVTLVPWCGKC